MPNKKITNRKFADFHIAELKKNKKESEKYLKIAFEEYLQDGNKEAFYQALQDIVTAGVGMSELSRKTDLNRQNLYKIFSGKGNPGLETIANILSSAGFTMTIKRMAH